jgi:hypothetical protein
MTRVRNVTRTVGAVGALVGLVVGVPVALALGIGWPLPREVPSLDELGRALSGSSISDGAIMGILAAVLWVAWFAFVCCVALEVVRALRGQQVRIPLAGTFARWMVSSMTLASSLVGARPALAEVVPSYSPAAVVVDESAYHVVDTPTPPTPAPTAEEGSYLVVEPGQTLWGIAEETVGDPYRWPEFFELNVGVEQPDGRWLRKPDLIRPGWRLKLPADAVVMSPAPPVANDETTAPTPVPTTAPAPAAVDEAAPASRSATRTPAAPMAVPTPMPSESPAGPTTTAAPANASDDAELASALRLPDQAASRPTPQNPTTTTTPDRRVEPGEQPPAEDGRGVLDELPIPMGGQGLFGAALLGAGVVGALQLRRRVQMRHRRAGTRIPVAEEQLASAELALRAGADPDGAAFVDLALRALASGVQSKGMESPQILGVQLGSRELEVVLAEPMAPAPLRFRARAGGSRWVLARRVGLDELEDLAADVPAPLPALVTLGTDENDARVLYDLEEPGLTCLTGDIEAARQILYAAAAELATSSYGEFYSLVLVGFGEGLAPLERVRVVPSLAEVIDDLERDAAEVGQLLVESELDSTVDGRIQGVSVDSWAPTLVLCAEVPPARLARRLASLADGAGNAGVAILVAGEMDAGTRLETDGELLEVTPMGVAVAPQRLSEEEAGEIGELLEMVFEDPDAGSEEDGGWAALSPELEQSDDVGLLWAEEAVEDTTMSDELDQGAAEEQESIRGRATPAAEARPGGPGDRVATSTVDPLVDGALDVESGVMVGVLGPIEITGGESVIDRGKSIELVVYLATHRKGRVDTDVVMEALWPGKPPNGRTLNTTTTAARTSLGKDASGELYLPRISGGGDRLYRVSDKVRLDYEVFMALVERAAGREGPAAIATLRMALSLVRGRPFQVLGKGYEWAHVGLATRMAEDVADAAHRMARLCLDAGDPQGARWAAQQGLLASEGNEQLFRDRMSAEHLSGNLAGIRAVMEDLTTLVDDEEPYGSIHPDTVALFKELTGAAR